MSPSAASTNGLEICIICSDFELSYKNFEVNKSQKDEFFNMIVSSKDLVIIIC